MSLFELFGGRAIPPSHDFESLERPGSPNDFLMTPPGFDSASIATKLLQALGGSTVLGPLLVGLDKPVQIIPAGAKDTDIVNLAAIASYGLV